MYLSIAVLAGAFCAKYIFNQYEEEVKTTFNETNENVYTFQYGAYNNKQVMEETCKNLKSYFYYKENKMYHVLIGISKDKNNLEKIKNAYVITSDIYVKKEKVSNMEFIESLKQYDNLINNTTDKNTIITAEKQILSKYEELVLRDE